MKRFDVEFTRDGQVFNQAHVDALTTNLGGVTDLLILVHGWNNDMAQARELYDELLGNIQKLLDARSDPRLPVSLQPLRDRVFAACQAFWPSKKFADADLIPGGGAASATAANDTALERILTELKVDPVRLGGHDQPADRAERIDRALSAARHLNESAAARQSFVDEVRRAIKEGGASDEVDDGSAAFFEMGAEELFAELSNPVVAPAAEAGGSAGMSEGGAAGLRDMLSGIGAAARRIANFATYYRMKNRAGIVGEKGLAPLIKACRASKRDLRIHLVGHSFGGRAVTAAAQGLDPGTRHVTMSLLQAAFSHNALSADFGDGKPGFYRSVIADKRLSGPIIITHTKNDRAVGLAYPLASRLARQIAAAVGDRNDPYGGLGRNGAQHTNEAADHATDLGPVGTTYAFKPGQVHNLLADRVITDHGDIRGGEVAFAILACSAAI
jgi:hypothetical protein